VLLLVEGPAEPQAKASARSDDAAFAQSELLRTR
jgi:hypothetical protein